MPTCSHCEAETPAEHYDRIVHNQAQLHGPWRGWRLAGRHLVSPDGDRITPERMRGLLTRLELEARRERARVKRKSASSPVKVIVVDLQDYRHRNVAAA